MLVITRRPITTALQANRSASACSASISLRHVLANRALAVVVERRRIPDRFAVGERAEAGVEMVVAGVDELDRNHAAAEHAADLLMAGRVAPHAVAGVERVAAEEGVAGAFEAEVFRHIDDFETIFGEPAAIVRLFALPLAVAESREQRLLADRSSPRWR